MAAPPRSSVGTQRHARPGGAGRASGDAPPTLVIAGALLLGLGIVLAITVALTRTNSTNQILVIGPWLPMAVGLVLLLIGLGKTGHGRGGSRSQGTGTGRVSAPSGRRPAARAPTPPPGAEGADPV